MTKDDILTTLEGIEKLLTDCKEWIDFYTGQTVSVGDDIARVVGTANELILLKMKLKQQLLDEYGIFYMEGV